MARTRKTSTSRERAISTPAPAAEVPPADSPTEAAASSASKPTPVRKHRIRRPADDDRPRAGGHVLTDRGWVPEQRQES